MVSPVPREGNAGGGEGNAGGGEGNAGGGEGNAGGGEANAGGGEGNAGGGEGNAGGNERGFHLLDAVSCPGFRFRPTDEELLSCYLKKKVSAENEKCVQLIAEVVFCNYEPWDLPSRAILQTNDPEWYFFAPRSKKYPKGFQTRRATRTGYWKATGKERPVKSGSEVLGTKRTLVFYRGRGPNGERTEWVCHEFSLKGSKVHVPQSQESFVLCRLCNKQNAGVGKDENDPISQTDMSCGSEGNGDEQSHKDAGGDETKSKVSSSGEAQPGAKEASSSQRKDLSHEIASSEGDSLFAEILEDNIVDIDDFPGYRSSSELPQATNEVHLLSPSREPTLLQGLEDVDAMSLASCQCTASRRIKLHNPRLWHQNVKQQKMSKVYMEKTIPWNNISLGQEGPRQHRFSLIWERSSKSVLAILFCLATRILLVFLVFDVI